MRKHPEKLSNLLRVTQWHQDSIPRLVALLYPWPRLIEVLTPHKVPYSLRCPKKQHPHVILKEYAAPFLSRLRLWASGWLSAASCCLRKDTLKDTS